VAVLPPRGAIAFSTRTTVGASPADLLALMNDLPRLKQMDGRLRRVRWIEKGVAAGSVEVELDVVFSNALITRIVGEQRFLIRRLEIDSRSCVAYLCEGRGGSAHLEAVIVDCQDGSWVKLSGWVRARQPGTRSLLRAFQVLVVHLIHRALHRTIEKANVFLATESATG
jgi:hypothetical protein